MVTMVNTVSVEQRLRRLDEMIAEAEMTASSWTRIAMERPAEDAFDNVAAMDTMWKCFDFLAALRVEKMNLLLDPTL